MWKGSCGCEILSGVMGWIKDSQITSNDFTDDTPTISAGSLFQNGTDRMLNAYWRRRVKHLWVEGTYRRGRVWNWTPWVILNMYIRSPRMRRWVRDNSRICWRAASYKTCWSPFTNYAASFCTFSNASASRIRMRWDAWIIQCGLLHYYKLFFCFILLAGLNCKT